LIGSGRDYTPTNQKHQVDYGSTVAHSLGILCGLALVLRRSIDYYDELQYDSDATRRCKSSEADNLPVFLLAKVIADERNV
jgi:hypothetical protein